MQGMKIQTFSMEGRNFAGEVRLVFITHQLSSIFIYHHDTYIIQHDAATRMLLRLPGNYGLISGPGSV